MHRASSFDIVGWAPSRDKSVELPCERSTSYRLERRPGMESRIGRYCPRRAHRRWRPPRAPSCCSIPFQAFPHLSRVVRNDLLGRSRRTLGATSLFCNKRAEMEARLGVHGLDKLGAPPLSALGLRSDTSEGATGMAKLFGQINKN